MKKPNKTRPRPTAEVLALRENCRYWRDSYYQLRNALASLIVAHSDPKLPTKYYQTRRGTLIDATGYEHIFDAGMIGGGIILTKRKPEPPLVFNKSKCKYKFKSKICKATKKRK